MSQQAFFESFSGSAPENYQRYFVPAIGAPLAADLIAVAALRPGERVLDVACGTGVVTRLAAERVGANGTVAGLDVNPGMLAVARASTPDDLSIEWHEASAESMPLPDEAFDVVLCELGLQFVPDKLAALREMRRVLAPGGCVLIGVGGPAPPPFLILDEGLARHIDPGISRFVNVVFSLHDPAMLRGLMSDAGFRDVDVQARIETLQLPAPRDFLWQYIHSTPLASVVAQADAERRSALERDVVAGWQALVKDGAMMLEVNIVRVTGRA